MNKCENKSMGKEKDIDVSIVIPLYKGQRYCTRILNMMEKNCLYNNLFKRCKVEVIFVNDYPDEKIMIEESDRLFEVRIVNSNKNMGIHASRIKGISFSRGEHIIMLDQDDRVTENWLYSQWNKAITEKSDYCVCNGWTGRFRVLCGEDVLKNIVNNVEYYLTKGNAICSPGQVIIRKKSIPQEWFEHVQKYNGADDFLLWLMILKKGNQFSVNDQYLYYHTPERNVDSIGLSGMTRSLEETVQILSSLELLKLSEIELLDRQIAEIEFLSTGRTKELLSLNSKKHMQNYIKFTKMLQIMLDWMKIRNRGIGIDHYLKKNNYLNIAIYGMGLMGECLYEELYDSDINIEYGIDCTAIDFFGELSIYRFEADLNKVDAVIMTVVMENEKLIEMVREKLDCPVITIPVILVDLVNGIS